MTSMTLSPQVSPHFGRLLLTNNSEFRETQDDLRKSLKAHLKNHTVGSATDRVFFNTLNFSDKELKPGFIAKYQEQSFWLFSQLINYLIRFSQTNEDRNTFLNKLKKNLLPSVKTPLITVEAVKHTNVASAKSTVEGYNKSIQSASKNESSLIWFRTVLNEARAKIQALVNLNDTSPIHYSKANIIAVQSKKDPTTSYLVTINRFAKGWFPPNSQPSQN